MQNSLKYLIKKIKIKHISYSDYIGGAALASKNINECLKEKINSNIIIRESKNNKLNYLKKINTYARIIIGKIPKIFHLNNFSKTQSFALISSNLPKYINRDVDSFSITNLHWINRETLSINDILKIKTKIVWTCHDLWPFTGSYHLYYKNLTKYNLSNFQRKFLNFDYWTLKRKKELFKKKKIYLIVPSKWMRKEALKNNVIKSNHIKVIGNPIDCKFWKKKEKYSSKKMLKLEKNLDFILFGGTNIANDKNKGYSLAIKIFNNLKSKYKLNFKVLFFGSNNLDENEIKFPFKNFGFIENKKILRYLYSVSELLLVTSKFESFCQVAAEAQACSTPVIAYKTSGLNDVIKRGYSGYLINKYNHNLFSSRIYHFIKNKKKKLIMSKNARKFIKANYDYNIISKKYINFYKNIINDQ